MNNRDLIKQYADTGLKIPEYQMNKLPNNILQTYLRKRLIAGNHRFDIEQYEFDKMDDKAKSTIVPMIEKKMAGINKMEQWELDLVPNGQEYINNRVAKNYMISESVFEKLPDEVKKKYLIAVINNTDRRIADYEWPYVSDEWRSTYVRRQATRAMDSIGGIRDYNKLNAQELRYLPDNLSNEYFYKIGVWDDYELPFISDKLMHSRIEKEINSEDPYISRRMFPYATDDQKYRYITNQKEKGEFLYSHEERWYDNYLDQHGQ